MQLVDVRLVVREGEVTFVLKKGRDLAGKLAFMMICVVAPPIFYISLEMLGLKW